MKIQDGHHNSTMAITKLLKWCKFFNIGIDNLILHLYPCLQVFIIHKYSFNHSISRQNPRWPPPNALALIMLIQVYWSLSFNNRTQVIWNICTRVHCSDTKPNFKYCRLLLNLSKNQDGCHPNVTHIISTVCHWNDIHHVWYWEHIYMYVLSTTLIFSVLN